MPVGEQQMLSLARLRLHLPAERSCRPLEVGSYAKLAEVAVEGWERW
jgi:hypothetical protein